MQTPVHQPPDLTHNQSHSQLPLLFLQKVSTFLLTCPRNCFFPLFEILDSLSLSKICPSFLSPTFSPSSPNFIYWNKKDFISCVFLLCYISFFLISLGMSGSNQSWLPRRTNTVISCFRWHEDELQWNWARDSDHEQKGAALLDPGPFTSSFQPRISPEKLLVA